MVPQSLLALSLRGRSASLRTLPDWVARRIGKRLIYRPFLATRPLISGIGSIFLVPPGETGPPRRPIPASDARPPLGRTALPEAVEIGRQNDLDRGWHNI